MKVALFNGASMLSYGGGEQGFIVISNYLWSKGVHVTLFDYDYAPIKRISIRRLSELTPVPVIPYSGLHLFGVEELPFTKSYLRALMSMRGYETVYTTNTSLTHTIAIRFFTWLFGNRIIFEISDPSFDTLALAHSSILERLMKLMRLAVISRFPNIRVLNSQDFRRYKRGRNRVYLLAPPSREFHPDFTRCGETFSVLFVGRSDLIQKGIDLLSQVVKLTLDSSSEVHFVVIGSGGSGESTLVKMNSLYPSNFEWKGFVPQGELSRQFEKSHLFISTSRYETFGMNILEAQRNGLPVIAFDVAGPSDIIKSIEQGVLVAPFDVQSFASSILAYYQKWKSDPLAYVRRKQTIAMVSERSFPNEALLESLLGILRGETKERN